MDSTSTLFRLLASALLFASVTLLVRHGWEVVLLWWRGRVGRDYAKFKAWSEELFLHRRSGFLRQAFHCPFQQLRRQLHGADLSP